LVSIKFLYTLSVPVPRLSTTRHIEVNVEDEEIEDREDGLGR
jgi:hypothetical protein